MQTADILENATVEWCGYKIERKRDFGPNSPDKIGFVVVRNGSNPMPGATWFRTVDEAKQGIAALEIAQAIVANTQPRIGHLFWMLMELTNKR